MPCAYDAAGWGYACARSERKLAMPLELHAESIALSAGVLPKARACRARRGSVAYIILIKRFMMDEFDRDEVLEQAEANAQALFLVAVGYVKEKRLPIDEFWSFVGEKFTLGWEAVQGKGARVAMRMFALNMVSVGGTLESLSGYEARAEAIIAGWPSPDLLRAFGVSRDDADRSFAVFQPIAAFLGLRYEWRRMGDRVSLILSQ
jgi:hypothetical protein